VLHCIPTLLGGGAERQLTYLAAGLCDRGWAVDVAVMERGPNAARLDIPGVTIHELDTTSPYHPMLLPRLRAIVQRVRPDIMQTWMPQMDVLGTLVGFASDTPVVVSERASQRSYAPGAKTGLRGWLGTRASAVIANSESGAMYWRSAGLPADCCFVIGNALPVGEMSVMAADLSAYGIGPATPLVLCVARLSPEKNLTGLLEAFSRVDADTGTKLLICGEGPDRDLLERQIRSLGLEGRVSMPGFVEPLWGAFRRADVFMSLSLYEGTPNALLEAVACECPAVLSSIPEHRALLDDDAAFFSSGDDPASAARVLSFALLDETERRRRAARAHGMIPRLSAAAMAAEYDRVYRHLLEDRSRA